MTVVDRVLTVRQPWADLIMAGVKDVENRSWRVPSTLPQWNKCPVTRIVGHERNQETPCGACKPDGPFPFRLGIHAGKKEADYNRADLRGLLVTTTTMDQLRAGYARMPASGRLGVLLGTVEVTGCHHADECVEDDKDRPPLYRALMPPEVRWFKRFCSRWAEPDAYHWTLADPQPYDTPIPMRGRQGLWRLPAGVGS